MEASADGLQPLGQQSERRCPVCALFLSAGTLERQRVWYCQKCRGVFLSNDDFVFIVGRRRARRTGPPAKPAPLNPEELKRRISCPACSMEMDAHPYYGPGNTVIDSCERCRMVWLDHGEVGALAKAPGRV
ncbi:MAG: zf-TFIIB domain-containing protein [Planctomycetes bacterium]|nr:zf-TFIIB domain-containing protein [Planctomycetota bacterium]